MQARYAKYRLGIVFMLSLFMTEAKASALRITCDDDSLNAEIFLDGKFKGECPVDIQLSEGTVTLRAVKTIDSDHERLFEQQIRIADGAVKRIDVLLSPPRLTPQAQQALEARQRAKAVAACEREAGDKDEGQLMSCNWLGWSFVYAADASRAGGRG